MSKVTKPWITDDLEVVYGHLTLDNSDLVRTRLLLAGHRLHKVEKLRARGRKIPDSGKIRMASFIQAAVARTGHSKSTIYQRLKEAEELESLEEVVVEACLGTRLANDIKTLLRISKISNANIQLDLVNLFDRQKSKAKDELARWEAEFGPPSDAGSPGEEEEEPIDEVPLEEGADGDALVDDEPVSNKPCDEPRPEEEPDHNSEVLVSLREALGIESDLDVLSAVQRVIAEKQELEARCKAIEAELSLYRSGHLGQLYDVLGVRTAKGALEVASEWKVAANA